MTKTPKFYEILKGEFAAEDWITIRNALKEVAEGRHTRLSNMNAGDSEWREYDNLMFLIRDIELFVLGKYDLNDIQRVIKAHIADTRKDR